MRRWELEYARAVIGQVESILIEKIESLEGRVPTTEEVKKFGRKEIHQDGRVEYKWHGQLVLTTTPKTSGLGIVITA